MATGYLTQKLSVKNLFAGLRGTLLAAFGLLAVGTVGLLAVISIWLGTRTSQGLVLAEQLAEAKFNGQAINNWLAERQHNLAVIVNNPADAKHARQVLAKQNNAAYNVFLSRLQTEVGPTQRFEEIFLLNKLGQVVLSTDELALGTSHTDKIYFQKGFFAPFISSPIFNSRPAHNEHEIVMTVPLRDEFGDVVGLLAGRINLTRLTEVILAQQERIQTGETYLVSQDRQFLTKTRSKPNSDEARSVGIDQALTPGPNRNGEGIYENYNGIRVVGAYRWIPDLEIVLLSEREESEALAGVQQLALVTGGVAIFVLLVAIGVALVITARITRPISTLTEAATAFAQGDLNQTVTVEAGNEIGSLAQTFNSMTAQVRGLISNLETHARALETTAEISHQLTTILETDKLLQYVVQRIQTEFNFYHVHVYLVEESSGDLVIAEGSGEVGRQLEEKGHRLLAGQGIVGTVASTQEYFLSNNVNEVLNFVRNPLLPKTNSELAVPLRKGQQVLGVLDIQSEQLNRFTTEDASLMQSIADQTAIALDNARLLADMQVALQKVEGLNRRLTRQSWQEFSKDLISWGYRYTNGNIAPISPSADVWLPPMKQAAYHKQLIQQPHPDNEKPSKAELALPLILRGEMIGVLGVKREETSYWAEEEVAAVEAIAKQVALALENARLSKEQEKTIVQLKDIDRLKSEFLTSMSHELRTPLNSIIGFADVLLQGIDGDLPEMATYDIRLIHNSGQHLLALINDILDLSKIEAGKMELVRESLDISESINDVLAASTSLVKDKPVKILVDKPDNLPAIYADKLRLNQILLNLVSNAAKFTHEGSITIKANIDEENPNRIRIAIIDTGIGIPPDKHQAIFDRFRQADGTTTRKYGGTGLGLAIALNLTQMHGGELSVNSQEGVGSEFYFTIPFADEFVDTNNASDVGPGV